MRETQRNIQKYKQRLVNLKSKLAATALLFVMSAAMLTTSTFAWIVLSSAPEVANISTTVASNGNLEIALASSDDNGNPLEPAPSKVGDSKLENITDRNITWGNLVNLNDNSYGLQSIVLRPAMLNVSNLLGKPLYAVEYGVDGRVDAISNDYVYTNFDATEGENGEFIVTANPKYGVRAVSNITYENTNLGPAQIALREISVVLGEIQMEYQAIYTNQSYMDAVAELMGEVLSAQMADKVPTDPGVMNVKSYMKDLYPLLKDMYSMYEHIEIMYWNLANIQRMINGNPNIEFSAFATLSESQLKNNYNVQLMNGWNKFKTDKDTLKGHLDSLTAYRTDSEGNTLQPFVVLDPETGEPTYYNTIYYSDLYPAINFLVVINNCTVAGKGTSTYVVGNLGMSAAISLLGKAPYTGVIRSGALKDIENYIGKHMSANVIIPVTYGISLNLDATITTNAQGPYILPGLISSIENMDGSGNLSAVAGDVYGMVIDFWVRTNAPGSYLILEGKKETEQQPETINGHYVYDYSYIIENATDTAETEDDSSSGSSGGLEDILGGAENQTKVEEKYYFIPGEENTVTDPTSKAYLADGIFYNADTGAEKEFADDTERQAFVNEVSLAYKTVVIGYDGVNRVWEEGTGVDNSTTQGKGSCYIFYPEDPVTQEQTLELLDAMGIAFVDEEGNLLTQAYMDTANAVEEAGKVIVPLELVSNSIITNDRNGDPTYAITALEKNEPTLITTIVYLDGTKLSNADVSATSDSTGYLNLQFGSNHSLDNMEDDDLRYETFSIDGSITPTEMDYSDKEPIVLTIDIDGIKPNIVTARFVRQLNANQGVLQEPFELIRSDSEGEWTATVEFDMPGTYVLRSVWLDGVEYDLPQDLTVNVSGFELSSVRFAMTDNSSGGYVSLLSAETSVSSQLYVTTASSLSYNPTTLEAIFRGSNQSVNVPLTKEPGSSTWVGPVTFSTSGTYVLDYLLVDGEYYSIPEILKKTVNLQLGIHADIMLSYTTGYLENNDPIDVGVTAYFYDDQGTELKNLNDITLNYSLNNSQLNGIDTDLIWDDSVKAYTGTFTNIDEAGMYYFKSLFIGNNLISRASAPALRVISFNPPVYQKSFINSYQYAPNDDASISVRIMNSSSASVAAGIVAPNNQEMIVEGVYDNVSDAVVFTLPTLENSAQNGEWKLTKIYMSDIYYDQRVYSKPEDISMAELIESDTSMQNYFVWDMIKYVEEEAVAAGLTVDQFLTTYVVNDIVVSLSSNYTDQDYDGSPDNFGTYDSDNDGVDDGVIFTDSLEGKLTTTGYTVTVSDYHGNPLNKDYVEVKNEKLTYTYLKNGPDWWTNRNDAGLIDDSMISTSVSFVESDLDNSKVMPADTVFTFYYPGTHSPVLTLDIDDKVGSNDNSMSIATADINMSTGKGTKNNVRIDSFAQNINVAWKQPEAKFTAVSPGVNTTLYIDPKIGSTFWGDVDVTYQKGPVYNSIYNNGYSSDVYIYINTTGAKTTVACRVWVCGYPDLKASSAETTIYNGGNYKSANFTIINSTSGGRNITFDFGKGETTDTQVMGVAKTSVGGTNYVLGRNSQAITVSIVHDGVTTADTDDKTYTFTLAQPLTVNANNSTGW